MSQNHSILFPAIAAVCFVVSCATMPLAYNPKVKILENASALLRSEKREIETQKIDGAITSINESMRKGEGSVYLGFNPVQYLKDCANSLRGTNRPEAALKLEGYAEAYQEENRKAFMIQLQDHSQSDLRKGLYPLSQAEVSAINECERTVLGQMGSIGSKIYDQLYGQWLIVGERTDEIIRCLVERHGWIGLSAPDGRRGARAPR